MIVALGGGKGLTSTLLALKEFGFEFGGVVETTDSGSSTGKLRKMHNVPAMGDLRRVIDHLAGNELGMLMEKRVEGHAIGNLVLLQLIKERGMREAVRIYARFLGVRERIEPLFEEPADLVAMIQGRRIFGEEEIDRHTGIERIWIEPDVEPNPHAVELVENAEVLILGPGSIFTSILPHLLVEEMRRAIKGKKVIYVANVRNDLKSSEGFTLKDYLCVLKRFGGIRPDFVIAQYPEKGVRIDAPCIKADVARDNHFHDVKKLGEVLWRLLSSI